MESTRRKKKKKNRFNLNGNIINEFSGFFSPFSAQFQQIETADADGEMRRKCRDI